MENKKNIFWDIFLLEVFAAGYGSSNTPEQNKSLIESLTKELINFNNKTIAICLLHLQKSKKVFCLNVRYAEKEIVKNKTFSGSVESFSLTDTLIEISTIDNTHSDNPLHRIYININLESKDILISFLNKHGQLLQITNIEFMEFL